MLPDKNYGSLFPLETIVPLAMRSITSDSFGTLDISFLYTSCVAGAQRGLDR